eukprot:207479-Pyramimonas_sp.AAC.1
MQRRSGSRRPRSTWCSSSRSLSQTGDCALVEQMGVVLKKKKKRLADCSKSILERHDETDTRSWASALRLRDALCAASASPSGSKAGRPEHVERCEQKLSTLELPEAISQPPSLKAKEVQKWVALVK